MAVKYMHTLNSEPAYFDGKQIVYRASQRFPTPLAESLRQIAAEQGASARYRAKQGFHKLDGYSYVTVDV